MAGILVCVSICLFCLLVMFVATLLEDEYEKKHPPDDDGCREEADDEQP